MYTNSCPSVVPLCCYLLCLEWSWSDSLQRSLYLTIQMICNLFNDTNIILYIIIRTMPSVIGINKLEVNSNIVFYLLLKIMCNFRHWDLHVCIYIYICSHKLIILIQSWECNSIQCHVHIPLSNTCGSTTRVHRYSLLYAAPWSDRERVLIPTILCVLFNDISSHQISTCMYW